MPAAHDFFIVGGHDFGRQIVASTLEGLGFAISATPTDGLLAKRGSAASTFWLGALAGKNFQVTFVIDFMVDPHGRLVARLNRDIAAGALKGGPVGASKTDAAFQETANAIAAALHATGILADSVPQY